MFTSKKACTIEEQRKVELTLISFLQKCSPEVYKLWSTYGDPEVEDDENGSTSEDSDVSSDSFFSQNKENNDSAASNNHHESAERDENRAALRRRCHTDYLLSKLGTHEFACSPFKLYASQPWLVYWTLQAANLLGLTSLLYTRVSRDEIATFLLNCLTPVHIKKSTTKENCFIEHKHEPHACRYTNEPCAEKNLEVETTIDRQECKNRNNNSCKIYDEYLNNMIGFAGSVHGDEPHLASTYAACCALCLLCDDSNSKASCTEKLHGNISSSYVDGRSYSKGITNGNNYLKSLPRLAIKRWLLSLRNDRDGSFYVHDGGEADIRASYCVAVVVTLLDLDNPASFTDDDDDDDDDDDNKSISKYEIDTEIIECDDNGDDVIDIDAKENNNNTNINTNINNTCRKTDNHNFVEHATMLNEQTALFVAHCQTHEGGFTCSVDGSEAHGAYTQCGLAALLLMHKPDLINIAAARRWLSARQITFDGGFNGRTNKLVDACYSYWVGSSHVLLRIAECYVKMMKLTMKQEIIRENDDVDINNSDSNRSNNVIDVKFDKLEDDSVITSAKCKEFMLAKEMLLLNLAQLVDVSQIVVVDNTTWDEAEEDELHRQEMVNCFLRTNDGCSRAALSHQLQQKKIWNALLSEKSNNDDSIASLTTSNINETESGENCVNSKEESESRGHNTDNSYLASDSNIINYKESNKFKAFLYEDVGDYYFNQRLLQLYVFACCQETQNGGLRDKPQCYPDSYHTCYSLSGVSLAQNLQYLSNTHTLSSYLQHAFAKHYLPSKVNVATDDSNQYDKQKTNVSCKWNTACDYGVILPFVRGSNAAETSILRLTNPIINIHPRCIRAALQTWNNRVTV